VDRPLLAGRVRAGAERQYRAAGDRRLDLGARVEGDDGVGPGEQLGERLGLDLLLRPLQRDERLGRRPVEPGLARRMRADDHLGLAQARLRADGLEPAGEDQRLVGRNVRRGAEVDDRRPGAAVSGGLDRGEEAVEVRCADHLDPLGRDALELLRLARLQLVPDEQSVGVLVQDRLAGEVVPAPDKHQRRQAEAARRLDDGAFVARERATRDKEDDVHVQRLERVAELGRRWDQALEAREGVLDPRAGLV
jgi:hypothetical protein